MRHPHLVRAASILALELVFAGTSGAQAPERPMPAYCTVALVAHASANVFDMISTGTSLSHGASEQNPLLRPLADHPVVLGIANGAMHGVSTYILWKMAKHHPKRTAIISTALTSVELTVAAHNMAISRAR